ncbi:MAG: hypothetical protein ACRDVZ_07355 [Jiangellaceae bacterium]
MTLLDALEAEDVACRPGMVEEHRACLSSMVCEVDGLIAATSWDDTVRPAVGLALVLFAGELASAVRPAESAGELSPGLVTACEQTVTAAMLAAAGCLAGLVDAVQVMSGLVD